MIKQKDKALGIFSGGLDSWLSGLIIQREGFEVVFLHFISPFYGHKGEALQKLHQKTQKFGINLVTHNMEEDYLDVLLKPEFGYGKAFNPCIDCHAHMFKIAAKYAAKLDAKFIFSGEVLGQRPKSQGQNQLRFVEKLSGLEGRILRPLSAKQMPPTLIEKEGIVNRQNMYDIKGRTRDRQIAMAVEFGLTDYPSPAGGCKLTDPHLKPRFFNLKNHKTGITLEVMGLARIGRHIYITDDILLIISRDLNDGLLLEQYAHLGTTLRLKDYPGPFGLIYNFAQNGQKIDVNNNPELIQKSQEYILKYSKIPQLGISNPEFVYNQLQQF